jgi:putative ABC transport system permease protein
VRLLASDFTRLVIFALVIAFPVSYLMMNYWLNDYAYRIDISWWLFALGALFVLGISWLTVSWHSMRAATVNPVESLRSE